MNIKEYLDELEIADELIDVKMHYQFDMNQYGEKLRVEWRESSNSGISMITEYMSGEMAWWYMDVLIFFNDPDLNK